MACSAFLRLNLLEVCNNQCCVWFFVIDLNQGLVLSSDIWLIAICFEGLVEVLKRGVQVGRGFEKVQLAILVVLGGCIALGGFDVVESNLFAFFQVYLGNVGSITRGQEESKDRIQGNLFHV